MNAREEGLSEKQMPAGMRVVVTVVMFFLALYFLVTVLSMNYADGLLFLSKGTIEATVVGKSEAKSKNSKVYYAEYEFKINDRAYSRKALFGLIAKKTRLTKIQYDGIETGGTLPVLYSKIDPSVNRYSDDKYKDDGKIWMILGVLVFGVISFNEIRLFIRAKSSNEKSAG